MNDKEVKYQKITEQDISEVAIFMGYNMTKREVLTKQLGETVEEIEYFVKTLLSTQRIKHSFVAKIENKVVGVMISQSLQDKYPDFNQEYKQRDHDYHHFTQMILQQFLKDFPFERKYVLNIIEGIVSQQYAGLAISQSLGKLTVSSAVQEGFKYIVLLSTNPTTEYIVSNKFKMSLHRNYILHEYESKYPIFKKFKILQKVSLWYRSFI